MTYFFKGQYDKAIADANKAIELKQMFAYAYELKAMVYEKMKQNKEAIEAYRMVIKYATPQEASLIEDVKKKIAELERQPRW